MTKVELAKAITSKLEGTTQKQVLEIITVLPAVIEEALSSDDEVSIPGVGKFKVKEVAEKKGIIQMGANVGKPWVKPAHKEASFKIASTLKEMFE